MPKIVHNKSLIFSLHVFLLRLLFKDKAFTAYNLTSPNKLSRLNILLGCNKLKLRLDQKLNNILVFQKVVQTKNSQDILCNKLLLYSTLLPQIKRLGQVIGFAQVAYLYLLRYAAGKAFNKNSKFYKRNCKTQH